MDPSRSGMRRALLAGLVIVAALLTWSLLRPRTESAPAPPGPAATDDSPDSGSAASGGLPAGTPGAQVPGETAGASATVESDSEATSAPLSPIDQRQNSKISRGLVARGGGGLLVSAVPPGSVPEQLRLQPGDVIVTVNGEPVSSTEDFARIYREQGTPTQLTILRRGREMHLH